MLSFFALCCLAHCDALRAGMMLCDVPTPALLLDCTTARQRGLTAAALNACLGSGDSGGLSDLVYVHCSVLIGRKPRDGAIGSTTVAGADCPSAAPDASVVLANLDATLEQCGGAGAFLGLGVNNHYTGGYYWGRSSGPGAAMPAPGVRVAVGAAGSVALLRVANSNDGKRSEWCEFLAPGDQCQLVPGNEDEAALRSLGVCCLGAEPVVEAAWTRRAGRQGSAGEWERAPWSAPFDDAEGRREPKSAADFFELWAK
ncbi:hypothetical protein EMIHUDRAFT_251966 [Emiliania huxleyi CCMP1516]|uniref:Uncharacterized protein n=2 Tax=Emiliania huxleyi TaxID=2903 RepID=A0A0D3KPQ5_EMIH1|nr:hypothetical protein EMIHUDRAFT_251966 [Emiliania huxleyi CCMP1516]EOD37740.1 hypothetical protein EMIHUDRAFT_251966 [Emiliania huxleyi CCMP1516]|eukprot:XP_005790169.1 hypothetical protein EMIHUDRAFT_251966 [Emiliania huxleyi CCMP1516]